MSLSTYYLKYGSHLAWLHRRRRRRAYAPTSNTASHDNHEKINSWVSFCFPYEYGGPLGSPSGRRSSAITVIVVHAVYRDYFMESACIRDFHTSWWSIWNRTSERSKQVRFLLQNQEVWKSRTKRFPCSNLFISYILRFLLLIQL